MSVNVGNLNAKVKLDVRDFKKGLRNIKQGFNDIMDQGMMLNKTLGLVGEGFRAIEAVGKPLLDIGLKMENLNTAFNSIFKDSKNASEEMQFLRDLSESLGQEFFSVAEAYKGISAAAQGTNMEGEQTRELFTAMLEAGTALKMNNDQIEGSLNAVQQMMSRGNVQAEELRGQLGERLYGAFLLAAEGMGMTTQELNKALESGQVLSTDLLPRLAKVLRNEFGEAAKEASESTQANINRMVNAWNRLKEKIAGSKFMEGVTAAVKALAEAFDDPQLLEVMGQLGELAGSAGKALAQNLVPALKMTLESLSKIKEIWDSMSPELLGALAGGLAGAKLGGLWGAGIGAAIGALAGHEMGKTIDDRIADAEAARDKAKQQVEQGGDLMSIMYGYDNKEQLDKAFEDAEARVQELYAEKARRDAKAQADAAAASKYTASMIPKPNKPESTFDNPLATGFSGADQKQQKGLREQLEAQKVETPPLEWKSKGPSDEQAKAFREQLEAQKQVNELRQREMDGHSENEIALRKVNLQYDVLLKKFPELKAHIEELREAALAAGELMQSMDLGNSESLAEGWNATIEGFKDRILSLVEMGKQVALDMSEAMADTFKDIVGDAIDGEMKSWSEYVSSFLDIKDRILSLGEMGKQVVLDMSQAVADTFKDIFGNAIDGEMMNWPEFVTSILDIKDRILSLGEMGKQVALDMSQAMADTFKDIFGDAIDGEMKNWSEYVTSFLSIKDRILSLGEMGKQVVLDMAQGIGSTFMDIFGNAIGGGMKNWSEFVTSILGIKDRILSLGEMGKQVVLDMAQGIGSTFMDIFGNAIGGGMKNWPEFVTSILGIKDRILSLGEMGKQVALDMSQGMADTFKGIFGDAIDGEMKSWSEYVTSFFSIKDRILSLGEMGKQVMLDISQGIGNTFKGLFGNAMNYVSGFLQNIVSSFSSMVSQYLPSIMTSLFGFSQGGVFSGGGKLVPFAHGGINPGVPQFFPMANGSVGLWGEAGPEAIMPLTRMSNGDLGVQTSGGGGTRQVEVHIVNESGQQLEAKSVNSSVDMQREIITIVMDGVANNVEGAGEFFGVR